MQNFATVLYEKFFMRDLLGKFAPGLVSLLAIVYGFDIDLGKFASNKEWLWLYLVAAIPICLLVGLALQVTGEFVGLHSASPYPRRILIFSVPRRWIQANEDSDMRQVQFLKQMGEEARAQRERFVCLKEGSGNLALAMIVLAICLSINPVEGLDKASLFALFIFAAILWIVHILHAKRQAGFEIRSLVLEGADVLSNEKAVQMTDRLPKWLP